MQKFDVLIVGAGMVGLSLALAIRKSSQLSVAIVDATPITALSDEPELRVSAINGVSEQFLTNLDVWPLIEAQRLQPYQQMHVWDKAGYGTLDFDVDDLSSSVHQSRHLGHIIENKVIRNALWNKAQSDADIHFFTDNLLSSIGVSDDDVFASFSAAENNQVTAPIIANLLVGADGANSWVRKQMNMPMAFRDYDHHAIVATVKCPQGHKNTAWQVFLPTGPLALLPLFKAKQYKGDLCSIVWSTSPEEAKRLTALSASEFAKEITAATDGKLGVISLESDRQTYPLTMRLAHDFIKERAVLIGDAAHTIHPLAGQGVNLGLLDAAALAQFVNQEAEQHFVQKNHAQKSIPNKKPINEKALKAFSRWRKTEATEMVIAMEAIKQLFTPQQPLAKAIRGIGMSLLNNFNPAKKLLINQALGYKNNLPDLMKKQR
jgi:2-octaprenylphenol hydroxylase